MSSAGQEMNLIQTISYDTRKILDPKNTAFFTLKGEFRDGHQFIEDAYNKGVRIFVVSDKKYLEKYKNAEFHLVDSVLESLQKLAKNHREKFSYPVIGITGSVGKTTVKEWLYHLLMFKFKIVRSPKSYNSQLGVALSILEMNSEYELAIFEAGISKKDEMQELAEMIQADFGIFTAFASAHSQNFALKSEHLKEKEKLFLDCKKVFVLDEIQVNSIENCEKVSLNSFDELLSFSPFQDKASLQNLSLALALAIELGAKEDDLIEQIKTLPRLALRMETFDGINGNIVINDSYNADLDALTQSLEYQKSIAKSKLCTAIIGVDSLDEKQIQKIKSKLKNYNLYQYFLISGNEIPPIENIRQQVVLIKGTRVGQTQGIAKLFQLKKHKTRVEVNLSAIKNNLSFYKNAVHTNCKLLIMVKASSYGSGAEKMAEYLEKNAVDYLGVAYVDEGVELRNHGIKLPILVMNPDEDGFDDLIKYNLEPSIYSFEILDSFIKALINSSKDNFPIHLKFNTGMNRLGFEIEHRNLLLDLIQTQPEIKVQSIYSHLADSDNYISNEFTQSQLDKFKLASDFFEEKLPYKFMKHILNSEGVCRFPQAQFDMVRIGIGLYGISSNEEMKKHLIPAISWTSIISQINTVKIGESVGYSCTFIAEKEMKIAIIPVGYADGFKRNLSQGKGGMFVNKSYCPVIGNVCMDMTMIDVTGLSCKINDPVEILGEHQIIEDLAQKMQTIPYEVLTSLSKRMQRVYSEE
ncbi:MAG: alanine racemase [Bacteroidota bacterium]